MAGHVHGDLSSVQGGHLLSSGCVRSNTSFGRRVPHTSLVAAFRDHTGTAAHQLVHLAWVEQCLAAMCRLSSSIAWWGVHMCAAGIGCFTRWCSCIGPQHESQAGANAPRLSSEDSLQGAQVLHEAKEGGHHCKHDRPRPKRRMGQDRILRTRMAACTVHHRHGTSL